jgi:hypothetical protein
MSLVMDTLRNSTITEELSDAEVEIIEGLFEVQDYKSGEIIVQPGDRQPDNLYILAHGDIRGGENQGVEHGKSRVRKADQHPPDDSVQSDARRGAECAWHRAAREQPIRRTEQLHL